VFAHVCPCMFARSVHVCTRVSVHVCTVSACLRMCVSALTIMILGVSALINDRDIHGRHRRYIRSFVVFCRLISLGLLLLL